MSERKAKALTLLALSTGALALCALAVALIEYRYGGLY